MLAPAVQNGVARAAQPGCRSPSGRGAGLMVGSATCTSQESDQLLQPHHAFALDGALQNQIGHGLDSLP